MAKLIISLSIYKSNAFMFDRLMMPQSVRSRVSMMNTPYFDTPKPIYKTAYEQYLIGDEESRESSYSTRYWVPRISKESSSNEYPQYHDFTNNKDYKMQVLYKGDRNRHRGNNIGGGNRMNTGNQARGSFRKNDINITFADVAGCDEAKYELEEIVNFLKNPDKYKSAGAKVPKGVLLEGPPGTGKTLLARAVAGEANVTFVQVSASEFVEMYVGIGASRVRDLFTIARQNTPCVIFIDEIDAVGKKRSDGGDSRGSNDEREQTLNQILTSMDGFKQTESIVVLGATNRADILDPALIRSGRFDRKVCIGLPDVCGRRKILDIHLKGKKVMPNTDLDEIAILTSGFSGADIENMANEAVILALRENNSVINSTNLIDAYEKITIGLPMTSKPPDKIQDELVAYHESGHAISAMLFRDFFDVRKVTIQANTNGAGGYTLITPKEHYMSYPTKKYILADLIVTMSGRAAEIVLHSVIKQHEFFMVKSNYSSDKIFTAHGLHDLDVSTGASRDLKHADVIARNYVDVFGYYNDGDSVNRILPTQDNSQISLSERMKSEIDAAVIDIINYGLDRAIDIIEHNLDTFNTLASNLIEKKSLDIKYLDTLNVTYF